MLVVKSFEYLHLVVVDEQLKKSPVANEEKKKMPTSYLLIPKQICYSSRVLRHIKCA